jgi:hypothetical protein
MACDLTHNSASNQIAAIKTPASKLSMTTATTKSPPKINIATNSKAPTAKKPVAHSLALQFGQSNFSLMSTCANWCPQLGQLFFGFELMEY